MHITENVLSRRGRRHPAGRPHRPALRFIGGTPGWHIVTMPMLFTGAGLLLGEHVLGALDVGLDSEAVRIPAEVTLVVVLFTDASRMHPGSVLHEHSIAVRLLVVGLPLAMVAGGLVGVLLSPDLPLETVALLAVALAPADAALGQSFVTNDAVPRRVRQSLNVDSGLNDGLAPPFLLVLIDVAHSEAGVPGTTPGCSPRGSVSASFWALRPVGWVARCSPGAPTTTGPPKPPSGSAPSHLPRWPAPQRNRWAATGS